MKRIPLVAAHNVAAVVLLLAAPPANAWDCGPERCVHNDCSGGVNPASFPDTQPAYARSSLPKNTGRVADCPDGYTNNGLTCGRGADTKSTTSRVADCPKKYTNMGASCFNPKTFDSKGMGSMSCDDDEFKSGARCYKNCPEGYTNTGVSCFRPASTKGADSMRCKDDEILAGVRCYSKDVCGDDQQLWGGLCYKRCPDGSKRTAVSTCEHKVRWRGNTHLWVVNRAIEILRRSSDATAKKIGVALHARPCREAWEQGLWDVDDTTLKDSVGHKLGSHFYNAAGLDWYGKKTSATTYLIMETNQDKFGTARTNAESRINEIGTISGALTAAQCRSVGMALHYMTDLTQPMHSSSFSGISVPSMLHPVFEEYVPSVQERFPGTGLGWSPDTAITADAFVEGLSRSANALAADLEKVLHPTGDAGTICTMTSEGAPYTGYCFVHRSKVDEKIGEVLNAAYLATASYLYAALKSIP